MFKNNLKIAVRNILKHKSFSLINVLGLAIGIACSILIFLFVSFELSYDKFNEKANRTYRVAVRASIGETKIRQTYSSAMTFLKLLEEFPEIETGVKFRRRGRLPVILNETTFYEDRIFSVDSVFYDVFTIPLVHGDKKTVLNEPNTMVITEDIAVIYFNRLDVVGEVLSVDLSYDTGVINFKITGVSENVPYNSHFHYDFLLSSTSFPDELNNTGWTSNNFITYLVLKEGSSKAGFDEKLKDFTRKYMGGVQFDEWVAQGNYWEYYLQPLTDIHLTSDLNGEFEANGNKTYVYMFFVISIIILLIACINFMNLSTAKSSLRAKEVGMRKVVGAGRKKLIVQFLRESVLLSFIALVLGVLFVEILLPQYRILVGRQIEIFYFDNIFVIPSLLVLGLLVGIISGSYPAFVLSSFKPVDVLKGQTSRHKGGLWIKNALILFQFTISIFLIIGTITVYQQLKFFGEVKLGFDKEQVLVVKNPGTLGDNVKMFKEVLRNQTGIINVSGSNTLPGKGFSNIGFGAEGVENNFTLNICACDYDFQKTLDLKILQGRFFSRDFITDSSAAILNEKAVELLGWQDPIGKKINNWGGNRGNFTVVGVIEDYHYESLHQEVRPMALFLIGGYYKKIESNISLRLSAGNMTETMDFIQNSWNRFAPNKPYEYSFLDVDYDVSVCRNAGAFYRIGDG